MKNQQSHFCGCFFIFQHMCEFMSAYLIIYVIFFFKVFRLKFHYGGIVIYIVEIHKPMLK